MFRLILVRHGECQGNTENRFRGRSDFPLNETGLYQAEEVAEALSGFDVRAVYTSPLQRSFQTARTIAKKHDLHPVPEEGINNIRLGPWEGQPKDEIRDTFPEQWAIWKENPEALELENAEKLSDVQLRSLEAVQKIYQTHREGSVVLVSHRGVIKPLLAGLLEIASPYFWKLHIDTCAYSVVAFNYNTFMLMEHNHTAHLSKFSVEKY